MIAPAVDLEVLAEVLDGSPGEGEGQLDRRTGEVWPVVAVDYATDNTDEAVDFDDPSRWLAVPPEGSAAAYRDMTSFVATVTDRRLAEQLERAVQGRGAFRRFREPVRSRRRVHPMASLRR